MTRRDFDQESFEANRYVYQATLRDIEIVGEAVKSLTSEFKDRYPEIPWRSIGRVRDLLAHVYFPIKPERIWEILASDIQTLDSQIREILPDLPEEI